MCFCVCEKFFDTQGNEIVQMRLMTWISLKKEFNLVCFYYCLIAFISQKPKSLKVQFYSCQIQIGIFLNLFKIKIFFYKFDSKYKTVKNIINLFSMIYIAQKNKLDCPVLTITFLF